MLMLRGHKQTNTTCQSIAGCTHTTGFQTKEIKLKVSYFSKDLIFIVFSITIILLWQFIQGVAKKTPPFYWLTNVSKEHTECTHVQTMMVTATENGRTLAI